MDVRKNIIFTVLVLLHISFKVFFSKFFFPLSSSFQPADNIYMFPFLVGIKNTSLKEHNNGKNISLFWGKKTVVIDYLSRVSLRKQNGKIVLKEEKNATESKDLV